MKRPAQQQPRQLPTQTATAMPRVHDQVSEGRVDRARRASADSGPARPNRAPSRRSAAAWCVEPASRLPTNHVPTTGHGRRSAPRTLPSAVREAGLAL
jgi:hypothetical protein